MSTDDARNEQAAEAELEQAVRRDATVMEIAQVIADSRAFPDIRNPAQAAVRIMAGREIGVGDVAAVIGIRVSAGRVSMDAALMAGVIRRSGRYDYQTIEHTNDTCVLHFFRGDTMIGASVFDTEDAKKAGLLGKDTWQKWPRNMRWARAMSNGARWYCSDLFGGGIYTHEELGIPVDEDGRATDAGAGADLCTREQRQEIACLASAAGTPTDKLLAELGVRMLDELSGYEATKLIRRLAKKADAKAGTESRVAVATEAAGEKSPGPVQDAPVPAGDDGQTPGNLLEQAKAEDDLASTPEQRDRIIALAEQLEPDPAACRQMLVGALGRRNCQKISQLTRLQASALIEAMEARLSDCPFDAGPNGAMQRAAPPTPNAASGGGRTGWQFAIRAGGRRFAGRCWPGTILT